MGEQQALAQQGFGLFRGLVNQDLVEAALAVIDQDRAHHFDPSRQQEYDHQSSCPELRRSPVILDLVRRTPANELAHEALRQRPLSGLDHAQIAIRRAHDQDRPTPPWPHLDGFPTAHNGMSFDAGIQPFAALLGVFLRCAPGPFAGNLTVWPGSHLRHARAFRGRGRERSLTEGIEVVALGEPVQIEARPGDVVLAHYLLAHGAAVNTSATDRVAVYFRLGWPTDDDERWALLAEPWGAWRPSWVDRGLAP